MPMFRRALWVRILTVFLLLSNGTIEMRKTGRDSKIQFQHPTLSKLQKAVVEQYDQMKRWSPPVYEEYEPLTDPWDPYDDQWDDQDWSPPDEYEEFVGKYNSLYENLEAFNQMNDLDFGPVDEYGTGVNIIDDPENGVEQENVMDVEFARETEPEEIATEIVMDGVSSAFKSADHTVDEVDRKTSTDDGKANESSAKMTTVNSRAHAFVQEIQGIICSFLSEFHLELFVQQGMERFAAAKEMIVSKSSELFVYCNDLGSDIIPMLSDVMQLLQISLDTCLSLIDGACDSVAKFAQSIVLKMSPVMLQFMHSFNNNEFVIVLKEEVFDPVYNSLVEFYNTYTYSTTQYFSGFSLTFLSTGRHKASVVLSKYLLKVKNLNDKVIIAMSDIVEKVSSFVQSCDNKECLLLAVQSYLEDDLVYYNLYWLAVYTIIGLFLLYSSYVSNKAMVVLSVNLLKFVIKVVISFIMYILRYFRKSQKCKSKKVASVGSYCAFDENRVSISEDRYNDLMEASERKVEQLRRILQLENQLEGLNMRNMVAYLEMYQKQEELRQMQNTAVENNTPSL